MKHRQAILAAVLVALSLGGCAQEDAGPGGQSAKIKITVSILPLAFLAERIGGDRVAVHVLVGPGQSPHTYEPTPHQMADFEQTRLFVLAGVPYEAGLVPRLRAAFPSLQYFSIGDDSAGAGNVHDHREAHNNLDPHAWLDPREAEQEAERLALRLEQIAPTDSVYFAANLEMLRTDLSSLDSQLTAIFSDIPRKRFYVYHPAYGWLAERYGLEQIAIEADGKEPSPSQLADIIERARRDSTHTIFVQQQTAPPSAKAVAEAINARVMTIDPLSRDYIENLRALALAIATELRR